MKRSPKLTIFNDPIYGFIRIPGSLIFNLIEHPYFQRLRRISQVGMTYLVYPGAHHTRFHHALGAMHLMQEAIALLRQKEVEITPEEEQGLLCAILLHDIGHGPFSHALEHELAGEQTHETISLRIMERLNKEFDHKLDTAIRIFTGKHPKRFLNQLVSSQLDMDRLDYLKRDSFYTGVAEGNINAERLITMLTIHDGELAVEQKGIYSVEKFLIARRFMYWQVYLHKTGLAAEQLLVRIIRRARVILATGNLDGCSANLRYFLISRESADAFSEEDLDRFAQLDDVDVLAAIKAWQNADDPVLSRLCRMLLERQLVKIKIREEPVTQKQLQKKNDKVCKAWGLSPAEAAYFVFDGTISNRAYDRERQNINILGSGGKVRDVAGISDHLNLEALSRPVVKYYICYPKKGI